MSDIAIKVENLGKSYIIGHDAAGSERYTALRDVIAQNAKSLARKTRDMFAGRPIVQGEEVEEFWALKGVNFEIKQGERIGIIGRNGAGKSTLLKILSRITEPTTGRVSINGRVASLLEVGTGFHPELSGRENIFLNGAILGMSRKEIQRKFDEIVDFAEVERFLDTPVKRYSSGMYVRLAFAVAAHLETEILIVDEVLAVGDAQFQKKCLNKMEDVTNQNRTVLFVSHNMEAIKQLCSSCLVLKSGELHLASTSVSTAVAAYISNQWNTLKPKEEKKYKIRSNNEIFDDLEASITQNDKQSPFERNKELCLTITINIKTTSPAFCIGYYLYNENGEVVYCSYSSDTAQENWPNFKPGENTIKTIIPPNLLNIGKYTIEIVSSLHKIKWLLKKQGAELVIPFEITDNLSESPYWTEVRDGSVAPTMKWFSD